MRPSEWTAIVSPMTTESETPKTIAAEFVGADFGDRRLSRRLQTISEELEAKPNEPFPEVMTAGELEAFYRFVGNERVTPEAILAPHVDATIRRMRCHETVLIVHDTTEFSFGGLRRNLNQGKGRRRHSKFKGHFSLAVSGDDQRIPLGVLKFSSFTRDENTPTKLRRQGKAYAEVAKMASQQDRWGDSIRAVESRVGQASSLLHVMDSEADDYRLFAQLQEDEHRFLVRLCYDRRLDNRSTDTVDVQKTKQFVLAQPELCQREVKISARKREVGENRCTRSRSRTRRTATLSIRATAAVFRRPHPVEKTLPETLSVNIVSATEIDAPDNCQPVEWVLITTEPIATEDQVLAVIDRYRSRWVIEEYFKALSTGCAYEKRLLTNFHSLTNALAIFAPIAYGLLRLRSVARTGKDLAASQVLTPTQLKALRSQPRCKLPPKPSAHDAMLAVARLGGHLRSNGDPGWLVLARGFLKMLEIENVIRYLSK